MTYKELHQDFVLNSRSRWRQLVQELPDDDPARLRLGFGEIAFSIIDMAEPITAETLSVALSNRPRGWHTFSTEDWYYPNSDREEIERWRGDPERFPVGRMIAKGDYGRIQLSGNVYRRIGYQERWQFHDPGTVFDLTTPICDVGCMLLYAADIADWCGENHDIFFSFNYSGLRGRRLDMSRGWFDHTAIFKSEAEAFCGPMEPLSARIIRLELRRVLLDLLSPLFKEFSGFLLKPSLIDHYVRQEILGNYPDGR
ncbi:MAG: hypothetical protein OXG84_06070 [Chloroflexi bacterium]|nr:hypothetical protein [Chloroflexota bacterium]